MIVNEILCENDRQTDNTEENLEYNELTYDLNGDENFNAEMDTSHDETKRKSLVYEDLSIFKPLQDHLFDCVQPYQ